MCVYVCAVPFHVLLAFSRPSAYHRHPLPSKMMNISRLTVNFLIVIYSRAIFIPCAPSTLQPA